MDCVLTDRMQTITKIEESDPPNGAKRHAVKKHHVLDTLLTQINGATSPITQNSIFRIFRSFKGILATKKFQVFCNRIVIIC